MRRWSLAVVAAVLTLQAPAVRAVSMQADQRVSASPRVRQSFDFDWRFRAGEAEGAQAIGVDDASWQPVDLPHDFMIEGKGQAIVVPGGRTGGGRTGAVLTLRATPAQTQIRVR